MGGCGGPAPLGGLPGGSSPPGYWFVSDCHITRCYIPPWGPGPGGARETLCFKKRKSRRVLQEQFLGASTRERRHNLYIDVSSRDRLRLLARPLGRARPQALRCLSSLWAAWQRSWESPEARLGGPQESWRPGCVPDRFRSAALGARGARELARVGRDGDGSRRRAVAVRQRVRTSGKGQGKRRGRTGRGMRGGNPRAQTGAGTQLTRRAFRTPPSSPPPLRPFLCSRSLRHPRDEIVAFGTMVTSGPGT